MIKSLFRKAAAPAFAPRIPADKRVYAIGDIHGCDAEFAELVAMIDADDAQRSPKHVMLILLGDLVDRGPDSAGVVERARSLCDAGRDVRFLAGNHEEMLLGACAGDEKSLRLFARNGGRESALSYGVDAARYDAADFAELAQLLSATIPQSHQAFLSRMEESVVIGDYAFVHAGIRPGVSLDQQKGADLRWIRHAFLSHADLHDKFVVHGHTISEQPDEKRNRLGIDTGAYLSGKLTAVGLEGDRRWFLST